MKSALAGLVLVVLLYHSEGIPSPSYTSKYDNMNLDEVLANERLLTGYVNCLLDLGPCTPDGKELKINLPDAIGNNCKSCTERQRDGADKVMRYIIDNRPEDWDKLEQKYKSDGSYKKQYLESKLITGITDQGNETFDDSQVRSNNDVEKPVTLLMINSPIN